MQKNRSDRFLYPDTLIIIFAREPVMGQVKTRLIPALGIKRATQLYSQLLDYAIDNVIQSKLSPLELCITPESHKSYFLTKMNNNDFEVSRQVKGDLGERMFHAMSTALKMYSRVILTGSDCPFLTKDDLEKSIIALHMHDMVFSPAVDGGYVLVGAKNTSPMVFENIQWGSEFVMQQTRETLLSQHLSWKELPEQRDIDTPEDLKYISESFIQ